MQADLTKITQEEVPENVLGGISGAGIGRGLAVTAVGVGSAAGVGAATGSILGRGNPDRGGMTGAGALFGGATTAVGLATAAVANKGIKAMTAVKAVK